MHPDGLGSTAIGLKGLTRPEPLRLVVGLMRSYDAPPRSHQKGADWNSPEMDDRRRPVAVFDVEGDVVVPTKLLLDRHDSVAATFRPRLTRYVSEYLVDVEEQNLLAPSLHIDPFDVLGCRDFVLLDIEAGAEPVLKRLDIDRSVPRVGAGGGGADEGPGGQAEGGR